MKPCFSHLLWQTGSFCWGSVADRFNLDSCFCWHFNTQGFKDFPPFTDDVDGCAWCGSSSTNKSFSSLSISISMLPEFLTRILLDELKKVTRSELYFSNLYFSSIIIIIISTGHKTWKINWNSVRRSKFNPFLLIFSLR